VFHRGEECGGIGSKWIAENCKDVLKEIKFAIAFDRKDTKSIITYQRGTRCCSDEFAKSLAEQLGMDHKCDETGSFTDTASYVDHIAECTNVSAGYYDAHCGNENVNVDYLFKLRDAICKIDISKLVEKRKPGENTSRYPVTSYYYDDAWTYNRHWRREDQRPTGGFTGGELDAMYGYSSWTKYFEYDAHSTFWVQRKGVTIPPKLSRVVGKDSGVTKGWKKLTRYTRPEHSDVVRMIKENPMIIADMLESQGLEASFIKDYIYVNGGITPDEYYQYGF
jgi:hypothetical protein